MPRALPIHGPPVAPRRAHARAARPQRISVGVLLVLATTLGCGRLTRIGVTEAPPPLPKGEQKFWTRTTVPRDVLMAMEEEAARLEEAQSELASGTEDTISPAVKHPDTKLARLTSVKQEDMPASVTFVSTPPGATVEIDGIALPGKTPVSKHQVPPRPATVKFHLEDYEPFTLLRTWKSGDVDRVAVRLQPLPARLTLISTPPGATVWINGRRVLSNTPIHDLPVPAGHGRIELHLSKHEPVIMERDWRPNGTDRVDVTLMPPPARITFLSEPPGATVTVNSRTLPGRTPIRDITVRPGKATIEFRLEGHDSAVAEREWRSGAIETMRANLKPLWARVTFISKPPGATVRVNGRELPGRTPVEGALVRPGRSAIEFLLDNHAPVTLQRDWHPNASDRVEAELRLLSGRVRFWTAKAWDSLKIDGRAEELTPGEWKVLQRGRHSVEAHSDGKVVHAEFEVAAGRDETVRLRWNSSRPNPDRYVFLPAARVVLGRKEYAKENPARAAQMPAFWISRTEVKVEEYRACVEAGSCKQPDPGQNCNWEAPDRAQHPINCISAKDAEAYARWLSKNDGLRYELPTADQWERAARGTTGQHYPWGDAPPSGQCNSCDRSCPFNHFKDRELDDGWELSAPAGALTSCRGPEGIMDLIGNVAEWCRDEKTEGGYGVRGGSWGQIGAFLDPSFPNERPASESEPTIGFRLVVASPIGP